MQFITNNNCTQSQSSYTITSIFKGESPIHSFEQLKTDYNVQLLLILIELLLKEQLNDWSYQWV